MLYEDMTLRKMHLVIVSGRWQWQPVDKSSSTSKHFSRQASLHLFFCQASEQTINQLTPLEKVFPSSTCFALLNVRKLASSSLLLSRKDILFSQFQIVYLEEEKLFFFLSHKPRSCAI